LEFSWDVYTVKLNGAGPCCTHCWSNFFSRRIGC